MPLTDIAGIVRNTSEPSMGAVEVASLPTRFAESSQSSFVNVFTSGKRVNILSVEPMSYAVYNIDGKLIKSENNVVGMNSYMVSQSGIYIVKVNSANSNKTFKVIAR